MQGTSNTGFLATPILSVPEAPRYIKCAECSRPIGRGPECRTATCGLPVHELCMIPHWERCSACKTPAMTDSTGNSHDHSICTALMVPTDNVTCEIGLGNGRCYYPARWRCTGCDRFICFHHTLSSNRRPRCQMCGVQPRGGDSLQVERLSTCPAVASLPPSELAKRHRKFE